MNDEIRQWCVDGDGKRRPPDPAKKKIFISHSVKSDDYALDVRTRVAEGLCELGFDVQVVPKQPLSEVVS